MSLKIEHVPQDFEKQLSFNLYIMNDDYFFFCADFSIAMVLIILGTRSLCVCTSPNFTPEALTL